MSEIMFHKMDTVFLPTNRGIQASMGQTESLPTGSKTSIQIFPPGKNE